MTIRGFTMIELLMVITIVSILGAVALPQFLNFRTEARVAALQSNLSTIRVGYKNQLLQVRLKCPGAVWVANNYPSNIFSAMSANDITTGYSNPATRICTPQEIPDAADRKFYDIGTNGRAFSRFFGSPTYVNMPENPFASLLSPPASALVGASFAHTQAQIDAAGGTCAFISSLLGVNVVHWAFAPNSNQVIFAATNTSGVNECQH